MAMSGLKGLLEMVGFEVTMEGVLTGTHSESWGEIPDFGSSNAENASSRAPNEV